MIRRQLAATLLLFALLVPYAAFGQQPGAPQPAPDPNDPIVRIKDEGTNWSQVMQTLSYRPFCLNCRHLRQSITLLLLFSVPLCLLCG